MKGKTKDQIKGSNFANCNNCFRESTIFFSISEMLNF